MTKIIFDTFIVVEVGLERQQQRLAKGQGWGFFHIKTAKLHLTLELLVQLYLQLG